MQTYLLRVTILKRVIASENTETFYSQIALTSVLECNCLLECLTLCLQTRVLVTHGVHWLPMVDEVLVMLDGRISERGSYEELLSHDGPFAQFLKTYLMEVADSEDEEFPECECYRSPSFFVWGHVLAV